MFSNHTHFIYARRSILQCAESEVGGFVVLGGIVGLQILACTDIPHGEALALDILHIPNGTLGDVLTILAIHASDEAAIAVNRLGIEETPIARQHIINKTTAIMDTKKKTSMMLSIGKAASYYIKHYDEINKNSNPFDHINPYYNPFTR